MARLRRAALTSTFAVALLVTAPPAQAADVSARVTQLMNDALDQDYLATNFKAAEAKLQTAIKVCAEQTCPKDLLAKVHRALGVVYAGGMERPTDAVEAFKEMIRLDAKLDLDANFTTDPIQKAYDEAKVAISGAAATVERQVDALVEEPWAEQAVGTPVPVYVSLPELPEGVTVSKVVVRYKPPGVMKWTELPLDKRGEGYGGYIPCSAVEKKGDLQYFTTAFDANLDRLASGGSAKEPRTVKLKAAISGRQPSLPDSTPPDACPREEEKLSCGTHDDCPGGYLCIDLACVEESTIPKDPDPRANAKDNWLTIGFSADLMLLRKKNGVCDPDTQDEGQFSCHYGDGTQVTDIPIPSGTSNSTQGGFAPGTMRVLVGYDRVLLQRITAGLRLGFAFLGHPEKQDGEAFFPVHAEVRGAFHFMNDPFNGPGARPYAFLGGGLGEFDARVATDVVLPTGAQGVEETFRVDAHQKGGMFFANVGAGIQYSPATNLALIFEVLGRQSFPTSTTTIAPYLGFGYGL